MSRYSWLVGLGLAALLGGAPPTTAGGPGLGIVAMHGKVEVKPLHGKGNWRPAKRGELVGYYLLRTGPNSWVRLRDFETPKSRRGDIACVEPNSILHLRSSCGYDIVVLRGQVTAVDGWPGKSLFRVASK